MKRFLHSAAKRLPLLLLLCLLPTALWAEPPHKRMREQTVRILCIGEPGDDDSTGSGFVVDGGRHVVTNNHVIRGCAKIVVGFLQDRRGGDAGGERLKLIPATAPWKNERKDLAIVRLETPVRPNKAVRFAAKETVEDGARVVAVGFPGSADRAMNESFFEATTTTGIVSRVLLDEQRARTLIQTDAAINPGNSGGPLFNEFGQVIGINSEGPGDRARGGGHGIGWAVSADELREGFSALGIPFRPARSGPNFLVRLWLREPVIVVALAVFSLLLLGMLFYMVATKSGRAAATELRNSIRSSSRRPGGGKGRGGNLWDPPSESPGAPVLHILNRAVSGMPDGGSIPLTEGPVAIGRDRRCQLVILDPRNRVSKRHCVVGWSGGAFYVEDTRSTNGTLLEDGRRIPSGQRYALRPGQRFMPASHDFMFQVDYRR